MQSPESDFLSCPQFLLLSLLHSPSALQRASQCTLKWAQGGWGIWSHPKPLWHWRGQCGQGGGRRQAPPSLYTYASQIPHSGSCQMRGKRGKVLAANIYCSLQGLSYIPDNSHIDMVPPFSKFYRWGNWCWRGQMTCLSHVSPKAGMTILECTDSRIWQNQGSGMEKGT